MYRIQMNENYRLECQGAAKVSVLYITQTDLYYFLFICLFLQYLPSFFTLEVF